MLILANILMLLRTFSPGTIFASISCQNTTCSGRWSQVHSPKDLFIEWALYGPQEQKKMIEE